MTQIMPLPEWVDLFRGLPIPDDRFRNICHNTDTVLIENVHCCFADAVVRIAALDARDAELPCQNIVVNSSGYICVFLSVRCIKLQLFYHI